MEKLAGPVAAEKAANTPERVMESPDYTGLEGSPEVGGWGRKAAVAHPSQSPPSRAFSPPGLASQAQKPTLPGAPHFHPKGLLLCHLLGPSQEPVIEKGLVGGGSICR